VKASGGWTRVRKAWWGYRFIRAQFQQTFVLCGEKIRQLKQRIILKIEGRYRALYNLIKANLTTLILV